MARRASSDADRPAKARASSDWKPKAGEACRYRYRMAGGERREPKAKIAKVHDDGTIDLEVVIPERGKRPVTLERVPRYEPGPNPLVGVPAGYDEPAG